MYFFFFNYLYFTSFFFFFFFFNDTATTEIYTLSLHDALPISCSPGHWPVTRPGPAGGTRSEEHTSELQSRSDLVCRLLLEKKKKKTRPAKIKKQKKQHIIKKTQINKK